MLLVALMTLACRAPEQTPETEGPEILVSVADPCQAALGGPASQGSEMAAWSKAHATWRFFGVQGDWLGADQALADSLAQSGFDPAAYGQGVDEGCWVDAAGAVGAAEVALQDGLAWVTPGTGAVEIPAEAQWVVVDFSALPAGPAGEAAALETLAQVVGDDASLGALEQRHFEGHPDNWQENVYTSSVQATRTVVAAQGSALPLGIYLGPQAAPIAHRIAGALRLQERAVLLGHDAHSAVAESVWAPIGAQGLVIRRGRLSLNDAVFPDRIPADLPWAAQDILIEDLEALSWSELPQDSTRGPVQEWDALAGYLPPELNAGTLPAAFLVAHGILDRFWVYGEVTGTDLDATLDAALEEISGISPEDRPAVEAALGHFMHALDDGHGFYGSFGVAAPEYGYLDLQIQLQGEQVLVRDSDEAGIDPGDEIVAIDGVDAQEWFAEAESRKSAATRGYRFDLASRELLRVEGSRTLTLQAPDGSIRDEVLTGGIAEESGDVPWGGTFRESGPLTDLGAPELYYVNINGDLDQSVTDVVDHLDGLDADGLVVDMRDYPGINHYQVATWLCEGTLYSPLFGVPTWSGTGQVEVVDSNYEIPCEDGAFDGPIVWLVSNKSVSAAENFSQMVVTNPQVQVAGQQSAATNGNITLSFLPGGLFIYFTGMRILNPDGSVFHGVGIQPDVPVEVTAADFADGRDPELEAAVEMLRE